MDMRLLRRFCGSIRHGMKSATILAFRNWPQKRNRESEKLLRRSKRREFLKGAAAYAGTSGLFITRFRSSWFKIKGQRKHENSAAFCITRCVTRAARNGQIPDDVR